jgi:hypothetical protein
VSSPSSICEIDLINEQAKTNVREYGRGDGVSNILLCHFAGLKTGAPRAPSHVV